jgi:uncharacterized membrane protein
VILALVLLSALLHATWNALLRVEPQKDRAIIVVVGVATLLATLVAGVRWGLGHVPFASTTALAWSAASGVIEWLYFTSLAKALSAGPLGPVYTISRGGAILLVWPISVAAFAEPLTVTSAIGSAVVFGGLALASAGTGNTRETRSGALAWATACAVSIAGYHLAYKAALRSGGSASAVFAVALAIAFTISVIHLGAEGRRATAAVARARLARMSVMGVICGGSFLILMEALAAGGAGYVLTLRNTSVLFAIGLAALIGERPRRPEILGAALVAGGAVLMAWPR